MTDETFLWGAATSSHQIEGGNTNNDWWRWEHQGFVEGGARSGQATDHWNRYKEDIQLCKSLGLNTYRFSVEWSRIEPKPDLYDQSAIDWYNRLITECENNGLIPMLTIHHFTNPVWFADRGGFTWEESSARFASFTLRLVKEFGDRIPYWCTLNEPMVMVAGTYLAKFMPGGAYKPKLASLALHNLLKSHVKAYDIIHKETNERRGPFKDLPLRVGIAHNMLDFKARSRWHPIEHWGVRVLRRFYNKSWLDAVTGRPQIFGVFGIVPKPKQVEEALNRLTVDFIGVNYYTKAHLEFMPRAAHREQPEEVPIGLIFARRGEPASDLDWAIHPRGIFRVLRFASKYGVPLIVTENGIADHDDSDRPRYIAEHLKQLAMAKAAGYPIKGYYHWSLLDNFEWIKGFWPRFGLFKVDYDTFERTPTHSSDLYRRIIEAHRSYDPKGVPSTEVMSQFVDETSEKRLPRGREK